MFHNREGRCCQTAVAGYGRLCSAMVAYVRTGPTLGSAITCVMVGSRWQWAADGGAVLLGNAIADR